MSGKMPMMFSQNAITFNKNVKKAVHHPTVVHNPTVIHTNNISPTQPQSEVTKNVVVNKTVNRSAPVNIRQLFNLAHIMANPGTPCKACGA